MTEKEAREIVLKEATGDHLCRADGYLEALDKVKGLEKALRDIALARSKSPALRANKALAEWEKEK